MAGPLGVPRKGELGGKGLKTPGQRMRKEQTGLGAPRFLMRRSPNGHSH